MCSCYVSTTVLKNNSKSLMPMPLYYCGMFLWFSSLMSSGRCWRCWFCGFNFFQAAAEALSKICIELENNRVSRKGMCKDKNNYFYNSIQFEWLTFQVQMTFSGLFDWLTGWPIGWPTEWLIDWLAVWLIDCLSEWLIDCLADRLQDYLCYW